MRSTDLTARGKRAASTVINGPLSALSFGVGLAIGSARAVARRLGGPPPMAPESPWRSAPAPPVPTQREEPPGAPGEAFATEPTAVSRDSAHGRADDARIDEWYAEHDAADVDVETPVGTTAADVGYNPDTGETDLQQPDTEPLLDPGTAKAIRSEAETMRRAADPEPD